MKLSVDLTDTEWTDLEYALDEAMERGPYDLIYNRLMLLKAKLLAHLGDV